MTDVAEPNHDSDDPRERGDDEGNTGNPKEGQGHQGGDIQNQQIRHRQLSARVPDHVSRGTFSTGAIVLTGATEFVLDFLVRMARPYQVAARIVMPHHALMQLAKALEDNIHKYEHRFGEIDAMPQGDPNAKRPSIQEVYDDLKLPDDQMSGAYANACIIGHSPAEFVLDFVTNFFPRSAVSSRVYVSARQAPQLLKGIKNAAEQLEKRRRQALEKQQQQDTDFPDVSGNVDDQASEEDDQPSDDNSDLMY